MPMLACPEVDPQEAARLQRSGALLVDVREEREWALGRASGAAHVVMEDATQAWRWPKDATVLVICRTGNRSSQVVRTLHHYGVDARNVTGGLTAWAAAGLPVVRPDGAAGAVA